jgi:hypothetical protein
MEDIESKIVFLIKIRSHSLAEENIEIITLSNNAKNLNFN